MAIKYINVVQVICDGCGKSIMLEKWQDAPKLGWAAPIDGAFQKCPICAKAHANRIFQEAEFAKITSGCPLVNPQ